MKLFGCAAALLFLSASPQPTTPRAPVLELDHVYIVVTPGAAAEIAALRQAGLVVDSGVHRHEGQGTASVAAFFENAYLELLWVDSSVTVDSLHRRDLADFARAAAWHQSGASPFGVGLHFLSGTPAELDIPTRIDSAGPARPGVYYVLLRQPTESLAPDIFIMPNDLAVTSWIDRFRSRRPERFAHPLGARRVTRVVVRGPQRQRPQAAELETRLVRFEETKSPYLEVEFDGGQDRIVDLRPVLPLILRRSSKSTPAARAESRP